MFKIAIATAAAVRLNIEKKADPTATQIFNECNTNKDKVLDAGEVVACFKKHNVSNTTQKAIANQVLKKAYIPKKNWAAVAAGVSKFTGGKVSVATAAAEMAKCNTNGDNRLSYREVKRCLKKHAKALGLTSKAAWEKAKWGLAKAAVISLKGLKKAQAAYNLQKEANKIFKKCNANGDNVLDYGEVTACMKAANITGKKAKQYGNALLRKAYIPQSNFKAVAAGIEKFTNGKVTAATAAAEMAKCNKNGDDKLNFKEVKACLKKHAKALGLTSKKAWNTAKWQLARAAVIRRGGLAKAMKAVRK